MLLLWLVCSYTGLVLKGDRLTVKLTGLEYINDDSAEVDVLYAQVNDPTDR